MTFYSRYNRPPSPVTVLDYDTVTVDQSEANICGLHYQLQRFGVDGLQARFEAMRDKFGYADTRHISNFADLMNTVAESKQYFESLPSEIRRKFHDNPAEFYDSIEEHPENAVKEGYISKEYAEYVTKRQLDMTKTDVVEPVKPENIDVSSETQKISDENLSA